MQHSFVQHWTVQRCAPLHHNLVCQAEKCQNILQNIVVNTEQLQTFNSIAKEEESIVTTNNKGDNMQVKIRYYSKFLFINKINKLNNLPDKKSDDHPQL